MRVDQIEIHIGQPTFEYKAIRPLEVKCEASNALMPAPTIDEANGRLRALAAKVGANAIIDVSYNSGVSFTSWKSLKATGLAVHRISDERICPYCAETIKRAASVCKHCARDLPPESEEVASDEVVANDVASPMWKMAESEPLRDNNNPALIIGLIILGFVVLMAMIGASNQ